MQAKRAINWADYEETPITPSTSSLVTGVNEHMLSGRLAAFMRTRKVKPFGTPFLRRVR